MFYKSQLFIVLLLALNSQAYEFAGQKIIGCLGSSTSPRACSKSTASQKIPYDLEVKCSDETTQKEDDNSLKTVTYHFASVQDMVDDFVHQNVMVAECQCSCNYDGQELISTFEKSTEVDFKIQEGAVNTYLQSQKIALTKSQATPIGDVSLEPTDLAVDFQDDGIALKMGVKVAIGSIYVGTKTFEKKVPNSQLLIEHKDDQLVLDLRDELGENFLKIESWADSKISFYGDEADRRFCTVPNTVCYQVAAVEAALHNEVNLAYNRLAIMNQDLSDNLVGILSKDRPINNLIKLKGSTVLSAYSLGELNIKMTAKLEFEEPIIHIVYDKNYLNFDNSFFLVRVISNVPVQIGQIELGDYGNTPCLEIWASADTRDLSRCKQLTVKKVGDEYVLLVKIKGGPSAPRAIPIIQKEGYLEFTNVPVAITNGPFEFRVRAVYQGNYISASKQIDLGVGK